MGSKLLTDSWIKYINLAHRTDRREHMERELARVGIKAERFEAIKTSDHPWTPRKVGTMMARTPGAVGCAYSQMRLMAEAYQMDKHAFILEDDVIFCEDFHERLKEIEQFLENKNWDVIWFGGTVHINPPYWRTGTNPDLPGENLGRDAECTDHPRIIKTYSAFSTYSYIVNKDSLLKVMTMLDSIIHLSMGIDWSFIKLGEQLESYMYLPGCCKQLDNKSDIGQGWTIFSNFAQLGPYWWQNKKESFDPTTFDWGDAKINNINEISK